MLDEIKQLYKHRRALSRSCSTTRIALEGLSRHTGVHAAGVVIAPGPLDDYVPVCTSPPRAPAPATKRRSSSRSTT